MEKWETHLPQQAEENKTEAAEVPAEAPEAKETALNPRIQALKAARDAAERKLQEAILDLETREQSPAFQKAEELFHKGLRLTTQPHWEGGRVFVLDSSKAANGLDNGGEGRHSHVDMGELNEGDAEHYRDLSRESSLLQELSLVDRPDRSLVLTHLLNLTAEEG